MKPACNLNLRVPSLFFNYNCCSMSASHGRYTLYIILNLNLNKKAASGIFEIFRCKMIHELVLGLGGFALFLMLDVRV